jgi:hypothetical protein
MVAALSKSLIGGRKATGHEAEAKFQNKAQQHQVRPALPDLEHAMAAAWNSLNSADAKRGYRHAIDEFVDWYCSEPRLAFNRNPLRFNRYSFKTGAGSWFSKNRRYRMRHPCGRRALIRMRASTPLIFALISVPSMSIRRSCEKHRESSPRAMRMVGRGARDERTEAKRPGQNHHIARARHEWKYGRPQEETRECAAKVQRNGFGGSATNGRF